MQFLVLVPLAAFIILIVLIAKSAGHSTRIATIEWELKKFHALERRVNELQAYIEALKAEIADLKLPAVRKKEPPPAKIVLPSVETLPTSSGVSSPVIEPPRPQQIPVEPSTPSRTREEWEALIGGKLFNRIGALALIIGIGYFLKYAFDNNWIGETTRVLIGAVIGLACLGGGYQTNKKGFQIFAQGLVGAGIAILYLSVYAAFNFYHLVPQWFAFVLMSIVTIVAFVNGIYYDSLAEGILGWAGGFFTPLLLSTGQANEVGLFSYIVLLDVGLLATVVRKERWWILEPLTFAGTWLMYVMWRDPYYTDADLWVTVLFVTLFWVLFLVSDMLRWRKPGSGTNVSQIIPGLNAFFYFLAVYFLINKDNHAWMGLVTLLIGSVYFGLYVVRRRQGFPSSILGVRMMLTTITLAVVATSIQFSDFDTAIAWSIEAAFLLWLSRQEETNYLDFAALGLFGLAVIKLVFITDGALAYSPIREFTVLLNHRALAFGVTTAALAFGAFVVRQSGDKRKELMSNILHAAWCVTLFTLVTSETYDFFRFHSLDRPEEMVEQMSYFRVMTFGVVWISVSLPLMWIGLKRKLPPLVFSALAIGLLAIVFSVVRGIAFDPIASYTPLVNVRSIALLLLVTGLSIQTQLIQRSVDSFDWLADILNYVQVGIVLIVLVLLTGETRDYFQKDIALFEHQHGIPSSEMNRLSNMQQLMLSGVWLLYSVALMSVGIWRKYRGMRFVAIGLFSITILKIFLYDLSFLDTLYRLFSIIALGIILLTVSWAYQRYKDVILGKPD